MMNKYFITGISTEVGKTMVAAIFTEALQADYWKPVQAGDLDSSDTHKISGLVSNGQSFFHPNTYALTTPASPHAAAEIDGVHIRLDQVKEPVTDRDLVIEGAGGLLVPVSHQETLADLIRPDHRVILVSRHYLGSINHTLLTVEALERRGIQCFGLIFNGNTNKATEEVIETMTGLPVLLRIKEEENFDKATVSAYAQKLKVQLKKYI